MFQVVAFIDLEFHETHTSELELTKHERYLWCRAKEGGNRTGEWTSCSHGEISEIWNPASRKLFLAVL